MIELKGKTIKAESDRNDPDNLWLFIVETEEGILWKLRSLKRSFPNPIYENGTSKVSFKPIDIQDREKKIDGLLVEITISAQEVPAALEDTNIFRNKEAIIKYDESKDLSKFLTKEEFPTPN